ARGSPRRWSCSRSSSGAGGPSQGTRAASHPLRWGTRAGRLWPATRHGVLVGKGRKGAGLPYLYLLSISARSANVTPPSCPARASRERGPAGPANPTAPAPPVAPRMLYSPGAASFVAPWRGSTLLRAPPATPSLTSPESTPHDRRA